MTELPNQLTTKWNRLSTFLPKIPTKFCNIWNGTGLFTLITPSNLFQSLRAFFLQLKREGRVGCLKKTPLTKPVRGTKSHIYKMSLDKNVIIFIFFSSFAIALWENSKDFSARGCRRWSDMNEVRVSGKELCKTELKCRPVYECARGWHWLLTEMEELCNLISKYRHRMMEDGEETNTKLGSKSGLQGHSLQVPRVIKYDLPPLPPTEIKSSINICKSQIRHALYHFTGCSILLTPPILTKRTFPPYTGC